MEPILRRALINPGFRSEERRFSRFPVPLDLESYLYDLGDSPRAKAVAKIWLHTSAPPSDGRLDALRASLRKSGKKASIQVRDLTIVVTSAPHRTTKYVSAKGGSHTRLVHSGLHGWTRSVLERVVQPHLEDLQVQIRLEKAPKGHAGPERRGIERLPSGLGQQAKLGLGHRNTV